MMSELYLFARSLGRKLGINRAIARLLQLRSKYEQSFSEVMFETIKEGDTVWDVGANVGEYTVRFREAVADSGQVIAFEPAPSCFEQLAERTQSLGDNVKLMNLGLSDKDGEMVFQTGDTPDSTIGRFLDDAGSVSSAGGRLALPITTADSLIRDNRVDSPDVIKIDVEGFELEVIKGMRELLLSPKCMDIFIEIHYAILENRGRKHAPKEICRRLAENGLRVRWIDSSHLHATRRSDPK